MTQTQKQLTIEELSSKLKPILGNKIDELYFKYTLADSLEEKNEIAHILGALYNKYLGKLLDNKSLLEPPEKSLVEGEYPISKIVYADKELYNFSLRELDWPRHVCISGMSGSGKTTLALNILNKFIEKDKPFLVFDWKKSFRALLENDKSIMCFTIGNDSVSNLFKTNINIPPKGVSPREWINVLCDLITESFSVSFGVHKILLETLDEIFEGWGVYKDSKHYPNWMHIKKMLEIKAREARGREATWYESALRIATVLTFGDFGKVINYEGKRLLNVEDLLDKRVILELNSLGNIEKKFFSEFILTYIYKMKKAGHNKSVSEFNHAILVDEAHNIFLNNKTNFLSESVTDMIYREMREYGTSLICLDQHLSKLSDTVKGNSACHIAFQQQLPQDVYDISSLMQLPEKKELFSQLPVGYAIVKLSERYTRPFLIKVPYTDLRNETLSDEKINHRMKCLLDGFEVEKHEPEFKEAITNISQINIEDESLNPLKSKVVLRPVTNVQEILIDFVNEELSKGNSISEIKSLLDEQLYRGLYNREDIEFVITFVSNSVAEEKAKSSLKEIKADINKVYPFFKSLSDEEKIFMRYLIENPKHRNSTVELYKIIGLSTRKGNVIKNNLSDKGLLEIQEEKNDKGWKKYIRISNSYSQNK